MKFVTVAGPPSGGKTSVILRTVECLEDMKTGVVKFDCLTSFDQEKYEAAGLPSKVGYSGQICPDHFYVSNVEQAFDWGRRQNFDLLFTESAGLCDRCSPHIKAVMAICVIDCLSGIDTPGKIGPMLRLADIVVVTKGDIVSQAEREVFAQNIRSVNSSADVIFVNGITGQGAQLLKSRIVRAPDIGTLTEKSLRFTTPSSICSYCTGETRIGEQHRLGMLKSMEFDD